MKKLFKGLGSKASFSKTKHRKTASASSGASPLAAWRNRFSSAGKPWLLLAWDIDGLQAALFSAAGKNAAVVARAASAQPQFASALDEVLAELGRESPLRPRRVALAARHVVPAVVNLPVAPDKPRPSRQMRELIQADLEPTLAEFGSLWSLGALLEARGYLSAEERERIESLRRDGKHTALRYGETALELDLIDRITLDTCLEAQEQLQHPDTSIISGWRGRVEDNRPLWLACGVGSKTYAEWNDALAERDLKLVVCLPLAWLVSEGEAIEPGHKDHATQIALELHREEIVAVHRHQGRILASRNEGRMERPLSPDWLARLIADWASDGRCALELVCLRPEDEAAALAISDDLTLCTGHPISIRGSADSRDALWRHLIAHATGDSSRLPRIVERELHGSPWANHDIRRLALLGAVITLLGAHEAWQHYALHQLETRMASRTKAERDKAESAQLQSKFNSELNELAKDLDLTRKKLEPLVNERERMNLLLAMRQNLPELLAMLAQAVGNDAVLESVRNSKGNSNAASIQVVAWSPSYTGAQAFADTVGELSQRLGYGVVQTEIVQRRGRNNKPGDEVNFWLQPESDDLDGMPRNGATVPGFSAPPSTGISAVVPGVRP